MCNTLEEVWSVNKRKLLWSLPQKADDLPLSKEEEYKEQKSILAEENQPKF